MLQEAEEAEKQRRDFAKQMGGKWRNKAFAANDLIVGDCADDCNGTCIFVNVG